MVSMASKNILVRSGDLEEIKITNPSTDTQEVDVSNKKDDDQKDNNTLEPSLATLPAELQIKIFNHLDRVSSTCLGLTHPQLYHIHKELTGKVPLAAWCILPPERSSGKHLYSLLEGWMGPKYVWNNSQLKFTTPEKLKDLEDEDALFKKMKVENILLRAEGKEERVIVESRMSKKRRWAKMEKVRKRLEEERKIGGWWENGVLLDGSKIDEKKSRWDILDWEGIDTWKFWGYEVPSELEELRMRMEAAAGHMRFMTDEQRLRDTFWIRR